MNKILSFLLALLLGAGLYWFVSTQLSVTVLDEPLIEQGAVLRQQIRVEPVAPTMVTPTAVVPTTAPDLLSVEDDLIQDCLRARVENQRSSPSCTDAIRALGSGR